MPSVWEGGARKQRRMNSYKDILNIKLERDLAKKCKEYAEAQGITLDEDWLKDKITEKVEVVDWDTQFKDVEKRELYNRDYCCARIGGKKWTGRQCPIKKFKGDYCNSHNDMLLRYGVTRFGDYRVDVSRKNPRKAKDFIKEKYNNAEVTWLWRGYPLEELQNILNKQQYKVLIAVKNGHFIC